MNLCIFGKYPPIQGGVSGQAFWTIKRLVEKGYNVCLVTNADEVESGYRELLLPEDWEYICGSLPTDSFCRHSTTSIPVNYIPWANPFSSKLFGLGLEAASQFNPDLILGWYFEPYGFVASQVAKALNTPYMLRHAGSDLGRLSKHNDLNTAYKWMISEAEAIITSRNSGEAMKILLDLGVRENQLRFLTGSRLPREFLSPQVGLNLEAYAEPAVEWYKQLRLPQRFLDTLMPVWNKPIESDLPFIGVYGKIGISKGSFELLEALDTVANRGLKFNFVPVISGNAASLREYLQSLCCKPALLNHTWILPPIPPWRVPSYLALCDVVCFLEREFPISFHNPRIPREVLASGKCFVCSAEIADKQYFSGNLVDGKNIATIQDPKDTCHLSSVLYRLLENPEERSVMGKHGKYLSDFIESELPDSDWLYELLEPGGRN